MRRVVMDADVGVDDLLAIWYLVQQRDVSLEAVTACHGNVSAAQAAANTIKVLQVLGRDDIPVALGSEDSLERALGVETQVHGSDGLGGVGGSIADLGEMPDAVQMLRELSIRYENEIDLLATGSLTNLGRLAMVDPDALRRFRSITFLGTVGGTCQPDAGHVVDANVAYDIGAVAYLQDVPSVLYCPVDVTATVMFEDDDLARIDMLTSKIGKMASHALRGYVEFHRGHTYRWATRMHDPSAAVALIRPELISVLRPGVLDLVTTSGREKARGVVVRGAVDDAPLPQAIRSGHLPARVVRALDVPGVKAALLEAYESDS